MVALTLVALIAAPLSLAARRRPSPTLTKALTQIQALQRKVASLERRIVALEGRMRALEERMDQFERSSLNLEAKLKIMEARVDELRVREARRIYEKAHEAYREKDYKRAEALFGEAARLAKGTDLENAALIGIQRCREALKVLRQTK